MNGFARALAVLLAVLLALSGLTALAEDRITTTGSVHLRKGPGLDYKSICTIGEGTRLTYDKTSTDDRGVTWYRVRYDGERGWVSSAYARKSGEGGSDNRVTTTNAVRLRAGAGTEYASRATIDAGTTLTYDKSMKDDDGVLWYHVSYRDKLGWVSSRWVKRGGGSVGGTITMTGDAYLRSGAGLDYAIRCTVWMGQTLTYDRTSKDDRGVTWYHVTYDGKAGWVSSAYARTGSGSVDNRVTTTGSVHLRSGPGLDYASRATVGEGETLTYDKTSKDDRGVTWYHVAYEGKVGWISSNYARRGGGSGSGDRVQMTGSANVRSGPGLDYDSIGTVDEDTVLTYKGKTRRDDRGVAWYKVSYRGEDGWVSSKYARLK